MDRPYAVLLSKADALRPQDIARVLARLRKVPYQDVIPVVRRCWGIIEQGLEPGPAGEMAQALTAAGLPATALPQILIEELPALEPAARLVAGDGGLSAGAGLPAPWARLSFIAAAVFREISVRKITTTEGPDPAKRALGIGLSLATGIPMGLGKSKEVQKSVETSEVAYHADLFLAGPARRLRVDAQRFDFSCLGDSMGCHVTANFPALLAMLARRAPHAALNRGARMLLESRPVREMGYDDLSDLERESRWLRTLAAMGQAPGGSAASCAST